mmetsp:Transcript_9216/g.13648  ORF Transcript_9216/g.13648 Transcript_9216/m.13648 type:complete len:1066 (+) Transcript_9216:2-3199(+)
MEEDFAFNSDTEDISSGDDDEEILKLGDFPELWAEVELLERIYKRRTIEEMDVNTNEEINRAMDPLGLKSNEEIKTILEGMNARQTEELNVASKKFRSTFFLSTIHQHTPYNELFQDGNKLSKHLLKAARSNDSVKKLVAEHFSQFVRSKNVIDELHAAKTINPMNVKAVYESTHFTYSKSKSLLRKIIGTHKRSEALKKAIHMLNTNEIFKTAASLRNHISNAEYSLIIEEYNKLSLYNRHTYGNIFKDIDKRIKLLNKTAFAELKLSLNEEYSSTHIPEREEDIRGKDAINAVIKRLQTATKISLYNEEKKILITYLTNFQKKRNPATYYLKEMFTNVKNKISNIASNAVRAMNDSIADVVTEEGELFNELLINQFNETIEFEMVSAVMIMSHIIVDHLPEFLKLGLEIANDEFKKQLSIRKKKEENQPASAASVDQPKKDEKVIKEHPSYKEASKYIKDLIALYQNKVTITLEHLTTDHAHQPLLAKCIGQIVKTYNTLITKLPAILLTDLEIFQYEIQKNIIETTWDKTISEISRIHTIENYKKLSDTQPFTSLPMLYENHIRQTLNLLHSFMKSGSGEVIPKFFPVMREKFLASMATFADVLHECIMKEHSHTTHLVLILQNIYYTKNVIYYDLIHKMLKSSSLVDMSVEKFEESGSDPKDDKQFSPPTIKEMYDILKKYIIKQFIRRKTLICLRHIQQGLQYQTLAHVDPTSVRTYVIEMLLEISLVHSNFESFLIQQRRNGELRAYHDRLFERSNKSSFATETDPVVLGIVEEEAIAIPRMDEPEEVSNFSEDRESIEPFDALDSSERENSNLYSDDPYGKNPYGSDIFDSEESEDSLFDYDNDFYKEKDDSFGDYDSDIIEDEFDSSMYNVTVQQSKPESPQPILSKERNTKVEIKEPPRLSAPLQDLKRSMSFESDGQELSEIEENEHSEEAKDLVNSVFSELLSRIGEIFMDIIVSYSRTISKFEASQLDVELHFILDILSAYATAHSNSIFENIFQYLSDVTDEYDVSSNHQIHIRQTVIADVKKHTRLQFSSFMLQGPRIMTPPSRKGSAIMY